MEWGIKKKISIDDLGFPLLKELRRVPKEHFAKQKLLIGKAIFKTNSNKCNSVELIDGKYYILYPVFSYFNSITKSITIDSFYTHCHAYSSKKVIGDIYTYNNTVYLLVLDKEIKCVFGISTSGLRSSVLEKYSDEDDYIVLDFEDYNVKISKKDFSYTITKVT